MERITFSTNDRKYSKVTAFIAKNNVNDTMECHAFLCHRQKMAKAIADALSLAYVQHKEAALKTEANNTQPPDTQLSKGDNFNIDNNVSTANGHLVDCENNEKALEINFKSQSEENHIESKPEENHNLVELTEPTPTITNLMPRHTTTDFLIDDSNTEPVMRARADSDSWAVMATGADSASNDDLELEFSNFARSRSTTNLADLHTSVHSAWDI
ncbi:hypothetical protein EB796_002506 [Bugula neritina]|uniref:PID domain-containing protein n=1 Tax=Bugula neritina TaxID=10212 RepID=A0A7J7KM04_BUGNE|nr:hypothetical protein EB796_002506 [Bugula neritina]